MARSGSFSGGTNQIGVALPFVHPADNDFEKGRFAPRLLRYARIHHLTQRELRELQSRVNDLYLVMQGERDFY